MDALRGFAMVLVIFQHPYHLVDPSEASWALDRLFYLPTQMAPVAFVCISGMMLGYFLDVGRPLGEIVRRSAQRAAMLLLVAHPAIDFARYFNADGDPMATFQRRLFHEVLITDTIAACLLLTPPLLRALSARGVVGLSVALLCATPPLVALWQPRSPAAQASQAFLFGSQASAPPLDVTWPLVPWLGIFLLGSLVGRAVARAGAGAIPLPSLARDLRRVALLLVGVGVALVGGFKLFRVAFPSVLPPALVVALLPSGSTSLLPVYLGILTGCLAYLLWQIDLRGRYDRLAWVLSVFGRTSLFTYVVQFLFAQSLPAFLGLRGRLDAAGVLGFFAFAVSATWVVAYSYARARGWVAPDDYRRLAAVDTRARA